MKKAGPRLTINFRTVADLVARGTSPYNGYGNAALGVCIGFDDSCR